MSLRKEFELVERGEVEREDLIDDVLQGRVFLLHHLVPHLFDVLDLPLQEVHDVAGSLG